MHIERIEVLVVGPEARHHTWSHDLPDQYQSNTLIRIFTDTGIEGIAGVWNAASYDYDRYTAEALRHMLPALIGCDPLDREAIRHELRPRVFPRPPGAMALIDIALWDIAGKADGLPLHRLLGGARERMPAYASTPMLDDVAAYMRLLDELVAQGFRAVKFHTWCLPDKDLELAREARHCHPDLAFMLDAENNYDRESALRVARALEALDFTWFEAPLPDHDLDGYRELTGRVGIPILPAGNWIQDLPLFAQAIRLGAWKTTRTDVAILGGITPAREAVTLSEAAGMRCELMSWGYTLASAANLHLMLGAGNCTYYEQPLPYETFEYGMKEVLRTGADGQVSAPQGPGLGLRVDWQAMAAASVHTLEFERRSSGGQPG